MSFQENLPLQLLSPSRYHSVNLSQPGIDQAGYCLEQLDTHREGSHLGGLHTLWPRQKG